MTITKFLLLACCILLSACQSTSIRELSSSKANTAKLLNSKKDQQDNSDFPKPKAEQLRMYVFTSKEASKGKDDPRDGYFIDFNVSIKPVATQTTAE